MILFETNALKKNVKFRARGSRENISKIVYTYNQLTTCEESLISVDCDVSYN